MELKEPSLDGCGRAQAERNTASARPGFDAAEVNRRFPVIGHGGGKFGGKLYFPQVADESMR